ncbi:hypothetical protein BGZ99_006435 [Dissophora globulifera]|uniref:RING-type E3 ubiquitin transferase n=1 Tax=Dissophora globulifera TaxID=979702 RepID=A0A9P6RF28_9FUNG|nr:hypothetical protein BGZ99_006435 [Dissophora globulifera]
MPATIPTRVLLGKAAGRLVKGVRFILRGILVAFIWLVMLPYFTIWIWRLYFFIGEIFAYRANGLETPVWNSTAFFDSMYNKTTPPPPTTEIGPDKALDGISLLLFHSVAPEHQWISRFILDCFEGQIISSVVVVAFVAVFLLREWVLQNQEGEAIRMGMDDAVAPDAGVEMEAQAFNVEHAVERLIAAQHHIEAVVEGEADLTDDSNDSDTSDDSDDDGDGGDGDQHAPWEPDLGVRPVEEQQDMIRRINQRGIRVRRRDRIIDPPERDPIPEDMQFFLPRPARAAPVAPLPPPPPRQALQPPPAPRARPIAGRDDELDEVNVEELEGILEVIGMHGSFWMLLQNSLLMSALMCASLGLGIWIPFMIGKSILLMNPLNIIRLPLVVLSRLTDPILDFLFDRLLPHVSSTFSKAITTFKSPPLENLYQEHILPAWNAIIEISVSGTTSDFYAKGSTTTADVTEALVADGLGEVVGNSTNATVVHHVVRKWTELAYGSSSEDRVMAVMIGYTVLFCVAYLYFIKTQNAYGHSFARVVRDALRQQGFVLKIAFFVAVEMIVFPLFCGTVIGLSTLPLFKGATLASRIAFYRSSPNSWLIVHWLVGTAFMFNFSYFIGYCRGIVRPGVMWFIRDPEDHTFHPVREILERPFMQQLAKLCSGAAMYFTLIVVGITTTIHCVNLLFKDVLPLRWPVEEPISDLPIDLLIFHLIFPLTVRYLNPMNQIKSLIKNWWRTLVHWLRLSSFMYASEGQRYYDEEGHIVYRSWKAWLLRWLPPIPGLSDDANSETVGSGEELDIGAPVIFVRDGSLLRVPNTDRIFHLKGRHVLVPVDEYGNALNPIDDLPAEVDPMVDMQTRRRDGLVDPKENTVIVYAPPHFKQRVGVFVVVLWTTVSMAMVLAALAPIVTGRAIFRLKMERPVHDIYSFLAGVYFLRGFWFILHWSTAKVQKIASQGLQPISFKAQLRAVWGLCWLAAKVVYFGVTFGVILPFILGIMVELFVILPVRTAIDDPDMGIILVLNWAVGLLYLKIIHRVLSVMPNNRFAIDMNRVFNGADVRNWDAALATKRLILPALGIAALATGGPFVLAWILAEALELTGIQRVRVFRQSYPVVLLTALVVLGLREAVVIMRGWTQYVRDQEYLVGRQLHNLQMEERAQQEPIPNQADRADVPPPPPPPPANAAVIEEEALPVRREAGSTNEDQTPPPSAMPAMVYEEESLRRWSAARQHAEMQAEEEEDRVQTRRRRGVARTFTEDDEDTVFQKEQTPPLFRSNSRRVRDPPVGSEVEEDDIEEEGDSIAQRIRLRRNRRMLKELVEAGMDSDGGQGRSTSFYRR